MVTKTKKKETIKKNNETITIKIAISENDYKTLLDFGSKKKISAEVTAGALLMQALDEYRENTIPGYRCRYGGTIKADD